MFKLSVNGACKQIVENAGMHETARRLYSAISELTNPKLTDLGEVAAYVRVTPQVLKNWESRGVSKQGRLDLHSQLGINPDWLATGEGDMLPRQLAATGFVAGAFGTPSIGNASPVLIDLENNPDYPAIRRVKFKLSAGASGFGLEYSEDEDGAPIVFQRQWYAGRGLRPEKLFAVKVANGSMEPGLHDGDTVVVNTASTEPKDGVVFAVNYEGELVIKRLMRDAGQWWLASDNADQRRYPRKVCDEHSVLIGEIVHKQSERI